MAFADIGDDSIIRFRDFDQFLDVVRMAGSDLDHGYLCLGIDAEDRQWNTDVIVQVALRGSDVVLDRQHSRDQFLGRGLAVGPRQSYDRQTFAIHKRVLSMMMCKSLQSLQRVRDGDNARVP